MDMQMRLGTGTGIADPAQMVSSRNWVSGRDNHAAPLPMGHYDVDDLDRGWLRPIIASVP
jgi:hypothetical protein